MINCPSGLKTLQYGRIEIVHIRARTGDLVIMHRAASVLSSQRLTVFKPLTASARPSLLNAAFSTGIAIPLKVRARLDAP